MSDNSHYVIILTGPTACGKTTLSMQLGKFFPIEIINVDVAQFYKKLSVGTAKPDWKKESIEHHCFDILDKPCNFNVYDFRKITLEKIELICSRKKIPVLVGGSLFYIKSLFYPTTSLSKKNSYQKIDLNKIEKNLLWEKLNKIDPERASKLHKNDFYRIRRALDIWNKTGKKPSECSPQFSPRFHSRIFFLNLPKEQLAQRINKRTVKMIRQDGWLQEGQDLCDSPWEDFLQFKGFIGYQEIFCWIKNGRQESQIDSLIEHIQIKTRQYAKRQRAFCRYMAKALEADKIKNRKDLEFSINISNLDSLEIKNVVEKIKGDLDRKVLGVLVRRKVDS